MKTSVPCPGCDGRFPRLEGPTHAYLTASPGCWARFGQALALHYSDHRYWPAHQLLTDAYSLQHSRGSDHRALRSAHVHLGALYAQLRLGQPEARVIAIRRALSECDFQELSYAWRAPSASIADVDLSEPRAHLATVERFARAVLSDWSEHHDLARKLCET
ncbi:MAG: DUF5946 family protein [Pseudomonadota bacterium]